MKRQKIRRLQSDLHAVRIQRAGAGREGRLEGVPAGYHRHSGEGQGRVRGPAAQRLLPLPRIGVDHLRALEATASFRGDVSEVRGAYIGQHITAVSVSEPTGLRLQHAVVYPLGHMPGE
jgi:hypothetical protein